MKQTIIVSGILLKDNKVFLAKRPLTKKIAPGKYHLPGGHVEYGEHPAETLRREFEEEFKLSVQVGKLVNVFSYHNEEVHTVGVTYSVSCGDIPEEIWFDAKDTESVLWADKQQVGEIIEPSDHDYKTIDIFFSS